ncbi:hypothetical protein N9229_02060 [Saprospiraceae bacterium]|nr:hypothetical protein [Saprospiraceae bacterium]
MKIGFLITARLKSSRLPLKLMLDLNGKSVVERVIDRTKKVAYVDDIVLCTSTNPQDRPLAEVAKKNEIYYYLGSEEDVLHRLKDAAEFFGFDYFVNITGENPLFSIEYANRVAEALLSGKHDFVYIDGLPIGCAVYGLRTDALKVVCEVKEVIDTEIWGMLVNQPHIFNVHKIEADQQVRTNLVERITCDYIEDYQFISAIFNRFSSEQTPSYGAMVDLLKQEPSLSKINAMHKQLALDPSIAENINKYYRDNEKYVLDLKKKIYTK